MPDSQLPEAEFPLPLKAADRPALGRPARAGPAFDRREAGSPDRGMPEPAGRPMAIKVLVIGEWPLLTEALGSLLKAEPELAVSTLADPLLSADHIRRTGPDVVLVDSVMLARRIVAERGAAVRAESPRLRLLIVTEGEAEEALWACVQAGAAGIVNKRSCSAELASAVKRVHAGELLFAPEVLVSLLRHPPDQRPCPQPERPTEALTARELEVLQACATGLSTAEIAERLCISAHTVRAHLKKAMAKLGVNSKLAAVMAALKGGLIELTVRLALLYPGFSGFGELAPSWI